MYLVRFIRKDLQPLEEYFYKKLDDAKSHFDLFYGDDSGLYRCIQLLLLDSNSETLLNQIFI